MRANVFHGRVTSLIRETWEEWIWVDVAEGSYRPPPFYLPLRRSYRKSTTLYVVAPLAIPALVMFLVVGMLKSVWLDLLEALSLIERDLRKKYDI